MRHEARNESEARDAVKQLGKADPLTEPVAKGCKTMYRARFAGLDQGDAEAACEALKRSDIRCLLRHQELRLSTSLKRKTPQWAAICMPPLRHVFAGDVSPRP